MSVECLSSHHVRPLSKRQRQAAAACECEIIDFQEQAKLHTIVRIAKDVNELSAWGVMSPAQALGILRCLQQLYCNGGTPSE
jgi:hypothetical protein